MTRKALNKAKAAQRKKSEQRRDGDGVRVRGRQGAAMRVRRVEANPICAECAALGLVEPTTEIDHIVPIAFGGTDTDDNVQGLCTPCHAAKSALEQAGQEAGATHPTWLKPSRVPVVIVCGPPAAGKSTWVDEASGRNDLVIDVDRILARLNGGQAHQVGGRHLGQAIRARNIMLADLARTDATRAWFITSAPTAAERQWWSDQLGGASRCIIRVMDPGQQECARRAIARGTPHHVPVIAAWHLNSRKPWLPPKARAPRPETGADGLGPGGVW